MMAAQQQASHAQPTPTRQQQQQQPPPAATISSSPWPLYDLVADVPHPAASSSCPPNYLIGPPPPNHPSASPGSSPPANNNDDDLTQELTKNIPQIARFAFPEYEESPQQKEACNKAALNKYDQYAMEPKSFQHFTFTLQLGSGVRLHGHVRRYLPLHLVARSRYDIGRRGERALVVLTRASGADLLYTAILKSVEAISSQQVAAPKEKQPHEEPQKWFLHQLFRQHQHLASVYATKPTEERGKPLVACLEGLELGPNHSIFKRIDTSRFLVPSCSLCRTAISDPSAGGSSSILPLLRCVGVATALRIMAALLSERRVIMVSASPTRLASCSHSAVSMLAQGLLHWQHLYIPVLPPHLWQYLAAPYPYLIGVLSQNAPRLDKTDGLGEVLIIQLDSNAMETRGMDQQTVQQKLPDLFQHQDVQQQGGAATAAELLAQDLVEGLKADKKVLYGDNTLANMGETAAKAGKAIKSGFLKLKEKGKQYLKKQGSNDEIDQDEQQQQMDEVSAEDNKSLAGDYIYTEGCHNAVGEEEARIAFANFFLCMFGNMRWYLSATPGQVPQLDRQRFLQQKRSMGEGQGTPIWPLLQNFCQTQMLEEFAKARVEEVRTRQQVTADAPLFLRCADYHRKHNVDFGIINVRNVTYQIAQASPGNLTGLLQTNARRQAMALTSNRALEGDNSSHIAQLVEQCRESSSVLFDVMSVIWLRLRDSRGMQWKHGLTALQILKNLLYHGPLAVVAEATDGLDKIRAMKYYENMRSQSAQMVRAAAFTVYDLLVDRAKLFHARRVCAEKRLQLQQPDKFKLFRDRRLRITLPFKSVHAAMHPSARGTVVQIPPNAPIQQSTGQREPNRRFPPASTVVGSMHPPQSAEDDLFGLTTSQPGTAAPTTSAATNEMVGLFGEVAISSPNDGSASNPFALAPAQSPTPTPNFASPPVSRHVQPPTPTPQQGLSTVSNAPANFASTSQKVRASTPNTQQERPVPPNPSVRPTQGSAPVPNAPANFAPPPTSWQAQPTAPSPQQGHPSAPVSSAAATPYAQTQSRPPIPSQQTQQVPVHPGQQQSPAQHFNANQVRSVQPAAAQQGQGSPSYYLQHHAQQQQQPAHGQAMAGQPQGAPPGASSQGQTVIYSGGQTQQQHQQQPQLQGGGYTPQNTLQQQQQQQQRFHMPQQAIPQGAAQINYQNGNITQQAQSHAQHAPPRPKNVNQFDPFA